MLWLVGMSDTRNWDYEAWADIWVLGRVQTAVTMRQVTGSMAGVVRGMDTAMKAMDLEKVGSIFSATGAHRAMASSTQLFSSSYLRQCWAE